MEGIAQRVAPARVAPTAEGLSSAVRLSDGSSLREGGGEPKFTVFIADRARWQELLASNAYARRASVCGRRVRLGGRLCGSRALL